MTYTQKYCLIQPLVPMRVGDEFSAKDWPLHVTIVDVFALDWTEQLRGEFAQLVRKHQAFQSRTTDVEYFGPNQEVKVRLVEPNADLRSLHTDIADFITAHSGTFNDPQYQYNGFRPHATMRGDQPSENYEIQFDQLALIDMFPNHDHTQRRAISITKIA